MPFNVIPISDLPPYPVPPTPGIPEELAIRVGNTTYAISKDQLTQQILQALYGTTVVVVEATHSSNQAATYTNGASGVGATLTATGNGAFPLTPSQPGSWAVGERVLMNSQTNPAHNGVYIITNLGSPSTPWVLTRDTSSDTSAEVNEQVVISIGGAGKGTYVQITTNPTLGTSNINYLLIDSNPGIITLTVSQAQAAVTNSTIKRNRRYFISNPPGTNSVGIIMSAMYSNRFEPKASWLVWVPDWQNTSTKMLLDPDTSTAIWSDSTSDWWASILTNFSGVIVNKYCIYNNQHYKNLTGSNGVNPPAYDFINWELATPSFTEKYLLKSYAIGYDLTHNYINSVEDPEYHVYLINSVANKALNFPWGNPNLTHVHLINSSFSSPDFPASMNNCTITNSPDINIFRECFAAFIHCRFHNCKDLILPDYKLGSSYEDFDIQVSGITLPDIPEGVAMGVVGSPQRINIIDPTLWFKKTLEPTTDKLPYNDTDIYSKCYMVYADGGASAANTTNCEVALSEFLSVSDPDKGVCSKSIILFPEPNLTSWTIISGTDIKCPLNNNIVLDGSKGDWMELILRNGSYYVKDFKNY